MPMVFVHGAFNIHAVSCAVSKPNLTDVIMNINEMYKYPNRSFTIIFDEPPNLFCGLFILALSILK